MLAKDLLFAAAGLILGYTGVTGNSLSVVLWRTSKTSRKVPRPATTVGTWAWWLHFVHGDYSAVRHEGPGVAVLIMKR